VVNQLRLVDYHNLFGTDLQMMYLKSIIFMPKPLRILCITNCLAWMGHILYCLYFTDFVGESVFGGDPSADPNSPEYEVDLLKLAYLKKIIYKISFSFFF
jgi:hypothetical protein